MKYGKFRSCNIIRNHSKHDFVNYNNNHTVFHNITVQCDRYNTATNHFMVIHNEQHKLRNLLVMKILCFTVCVFSFFRNLL